MNGEIQILTVSEITGSIKQTLEGKYGTVSVRGEISNYKLHSSGHRYFSIKDENAQISCVMWRSRRVNFEMADGMKVVVTGRLTVYARSGNYQIDCISIKPEGQGDLYIAFEKLKAKLKEKGYFDPERKKTLPKIPLKIGIATSSTGAAIRDMQSTIARRLPLCEIVLRTTLTQGGDAAADIAAAISEFQKTDVDVLIIGRGGGSIEDLWPYNEEIVANAIYNSQIPIVSAVGHEVDFTISDFVADIRAATPTAAGEVVTPFTKSDLLQQLDYFSERMSDSIMRRIDSYATDIEQFLNSYNVKRFRDNLLAKNQDIDLLEENLKTVANRKVKNTFVRVESLEAHLKSLNPRNPLRKGFAILRRINGRYVHHDEDLLPGDDILIERLNDSSEAIIRKNNKGGKWQRNRKPSKKNSKDSNELSMF